MAVEDKYFQFPVSILRHHRPSGRAWQSSPELCQQIVDVALYSLAENVYRQMDEDVVVQMVERYTEHRRLSYPSVVNVPIVAASEFLNVSLTTSRTTLNSACKRLRASAGECHRDGTQCRLRTDILWSMHDDAWPLLKARFLIAVYAGIGQNQSQWLSRSRLGTLASGYSGKAEWTQAGRPTLPTDKQCRYWIDQLWMNGLFQTVLDGQRRIYSNKFANDRLLADHVRRTPRKHAVQKQIYRL